MADRFILTRLRSVPLFGRLSPPQLELLADATQTLRFEPGMVMVQEGRPTQGFFLFASGRAVVTRREANGYETRISEITPGQYYGEEALHRDGVETVTVRIVEQSIVLYLARKRLVAIIQQNPEILTNLRVQRGSKVEREVESPIFKGQRTDESVLHVYRRHPWSFLRHGLLLFPLGLGIMLLGLFLASVIPVLSIVGFALGLIIPGAILFYLYTEWKDDLIIITDERVVKVMDNPLAFTKQLSEISLDRIVTVSSQIQPDFFAQLFRYGDVFVKTAGEAGNISFGMIHEPQKLQTAIFAERDRYREMMAQRTRSAVQADVAKAVGLSKPTTPQGHAVTSVPGQVPGETLPDKPNYFAPLRTRFVNEKGELVYRKHITVWASHVLLPGMVMLAAVLLGLVALFSPAFPLGAGFGLGLAGFIFVVAGLGFYLLDWDWRNDIYVLSDQSLTIIRKRPLWLENKVDTVTLTNVDNVVSDVSGLLNNLLNRGYVRIYLIGDSQPKVIEPVSDPEELQAEISRRQSSIKAQRQQAEAAQQRQAIIDYLSIYHQTVTPGQPAPTPPSGRPQPGPAVIPPAGPPQQAVPPTAVEPPPQRDNLRPPRIPRARPDTEYE